MLDKKQLIKSINDAEEVWVRSSISSNYNGANYTNTRYFKITKVVALEYARNLLMSETVATQTFKGWFLSKTLLIG